MPRWAQEKTRALDDPEFVRLYLIYDEAREWQPDDPHLDELAALMRTWISERPDLESDARDNGMNLAVAVDLMSANVTDTSPPLATSL